MLTEKEKECFRELLDRLELADLVTLTDTVTNRAVSTENRQEAIQAIVMFSQNASQLLRRKKMKREFLYQYLAEKGYVAQTTADKPFLCRKILSIWGSTQTNDIYDDYDTDSPPSTPGKVITTNTVPNPTNQQPATSTNNMIQPVDGQQLAEHFTSWFYPILNSATENTGGNPNDSWGAHHFWRDAKCKVTMLSHQHLQDECQGSEAVSGKLFDVVSSERLFLNANLSGVKGMVDTYGLARVMVAGTVHRQQQCLGIFEQSFGLVRDPGMENNWKIKFTELKLKAQPQVEGGNAAAAAVMAPQGGQLAVRH